MENNQRASILILINNLTSGGTQKQTVLYANELAKNNAVTLVVIRGFTQDNLFFLDAVSPSVSVELIKYKHPVRAVLSLLRVFRKTQFEININFSPVSNLLGSLFSKLKSRRIKIVTTVRGNAPMDYRHIKVWKKLSFLTLVNSSQIKNRLISSYNFSEEKVLLQHNILEMNHLNENYKSNYFLHVGRICKVKNQVQLARCFSRLNSEIQLHIVGDIEDEGCYNEMKKIIQEAQAENIFFHNPAHHDLERFYGKAEVFLLSSISEGMPNVVLEAQSYGIPVISSSVGDVSTIIEHGSNGLLYNGSDEELLESIKTYLSKSESEKKKMRWRGHEKMKDFLEQNRLFDLIRTISSYE